jgi:hypothetical protein
MLKVVRIRAMLIRNHNKLRSQLLLRTRGNRVMERSILLNHNKLLYPLLQTRGRRVMGVEVRIWSLNHNKIRFHLILRTRGLRVMSEVGLIRFTHLLFHRELHSLLLRLPKRHRATALVDLSSRLPRLFKRRRATALFLRHLPSNNCEHCQSNISPLHRENIPRVLQQGMILQRV